MENLDKSNIAPITIYHVNSCKISYSYHYDYAQRKKKCLECRFKIFCFIWGIHRLTQCLIIVVDMLHLVKENC